MSFNPQDLLLEGIAEPDATVRRRKINKALRTNADPHLVIDVEHNTSLHYAVNFGHSDTLNQILKTGISPNVVNVHGETPLHTVSEMEDTDASAEMAVALMDHKALLSHGEDKQRYTPLMSLILNKRMRVLARLVQKEKLWIGELVEMDMLSSGQIAAIQDLLRDFEREELEHSLEEKFIPTNSKDRSLGKIEEVAVIAEPYTPKLNPNFSLSRMFPKLVPRRM